MGFFSGIIGAAKDVGGAFVHGEKDLQQWVGPDTLGKIPGAGEAMKAMNVPYTYVISRPLSTVLGFMDEEDYKQSTGTSAPLSDVFSADAWKNAWDNSATMSPGQAVVIGLNSVMWGNGNGKSNIDYSKSHLPDPENESARDNFFQNNSLANIASGGLDLGFRAADPVGMVQRHYINPAVGAIVRRPVSLKLTPDDIMARPDVQDFLNSVPGKSFTELSNDPRFKASPNGFKVAALMSAALSPAEASAIYRVGLGDLNAYQALQSSGDQMAGAMSKLEDLRSNTPVDKPLGSIPGQPSLTDIDDMIQQLRKKNADLTRQRVNAVLDPIDLGMNSALTRLDPLEAEDVRGLNSRQVVDHAINMLRESSEDLDGVKETAGKMGQRTRGSVLPGRFGQIAQQKAALSIRNARDGSPFSWSIYEPHKIQALVQNKVMDPLVRVYQATQDVTPNRVVNFADDDSVRVVRSMLNTFSSLTADEKDGMLRDYAKAPRAQRPTVFSDIEGKALGATAMKYGLDDATAQSVYNEYNYRRTSLLENVKSNAYGVLSADGFKPLGPDDSDAVMPPETDSELLVDPYLSNQLQQGAIPAIDGRDLDSALSNMSRRGLLRHVVGKGHAGRQLLTSTLDSTYGLWKGVTLLTGHRAYNHIGDDYARTIAKVGALTASRNARSGMGNLVRNGYERLTADRQIRNLSAAYDKQVAVAKTAADSAAIRFAAQQAFEKDTKLPFTQGVRLTQQDVAAARKAYADLKKQGPPKALTKHRIGQNAFKVPGTNIELEGLFGGADSESLRNLFSSSDAFNSIFMNHESSLYESLSTAIGHDVIGPQDGAKVHANAIVKFVRGQLGPDPVFRKLADGASETSVRNWLENTAEGRKRLRDLHTTAADNVQQVRDSATRYLRSPESIQAAAKGRYGPKHLETDFPAASTRPSVHGSKSLLTGLDNPASKTLRHVVSQAIKFTGEVPDDVLVRHPLAATLYQNHMTDGVQNVIAQMGRDYKLTPDDLEMLRTNAIQSARHDMQGLLYDTSQFTQLGNTLRYIVPFYNAWYSAMSNWSKLIVQNPQLVLRGWQAKRALWGSPAAVDTTTGEPANQDTPMDNLAFVMHLPSGIAKSLGMGDMNYIPIRASTLISPSYADSIGSPGWGPLVTVPVNVLAKNVPTLADNPVVNQILGGRIQSNSFESAIPSALQKLLGLGQETGVTGEPDDDASRATVLWSLYQEQMYDYQNGTRSSAPNWSDLEKQATWLTGFYRAASLLLPLGFAPEKNHQFLTDQYQQMVDTNPKTADQDFYDRYGSAGFLFTQGLSQNPGGLPATRGALALISQNKELLQNDPTVAEALIGSNQTNQAFDQGAYNWEKAVGLRTEMTPQQAATQSQVNLGWTQYEMLMSNVDAQLAERGLVSVNQTGASDLKDLKTSFVNATGDPQSQFYNPDWYSAYGGYDQNTYQQTIQQLATVAMNPGLLSNPLRSDVKSLNTYFQLRDQAQSYLAQRPYQNITDASNADIADWFDYNVGLLNQSDTKFQALYSKYLEHDDLTEPAEA